MCDPHRPECQLHWLCSQIPPKRGQSQAAILVPSVTERAGRAQLSEANETTNRGYPSARATSMEDRPLLQ